MIIKIIKSILDTDIKFLLILSLIIILAGRHLEANVLQIIFLILFIFLNHDKFYDKINDINEKNQNKNIQRIVENNKRFKIELNLDDKLNDYMHKMKKYRKYNPQSYDKGVELLNMFVYIIHDLEDENISHPRQYFENAQLYLKKSLNFFQNISTSVPEELLIHGLKYNKLKPNKLLHKISILCKDINNHCYNLLYNLSLKMDEHFYDKPNIHKNLIHLNSDKVIESNSFDSNLDLY